MHASHYLCVQPPYSTQPRFFASASLGGRVLVLHSCHSTQYPASGDSVVTVLSAASETQAVDSAAGWTLVDSDDGEAINGRHLGLGCLVALFGGAAARLATLKGAGCMRSSGSAACAADFAHSCAAQKSLKILFCIMLRCCQPQGHTASPA